ncbi:MAG TPA: AIR synthase-related protein, partial [Thermomicrobiales bacterium]|nr:AIR synthase-related protein [Thermomicrobiales bacterium]
TEATAIMPTPTVGVVGVLDDVTRHATMRWRDGDVVLLLGGQAPSLGGSEYVAVQHGLTIGSPPALDLDLEARVQRLARGLIEEGITQTAHDCGLGGLMVALSEMALLSDIGIVMDDETIRAEGDRRDRHWFGEAPSRIIVGVPSRRVEEVHRRAREAGVPSTLLGVARGEEIVAGAVRLTLEEARAAWESALIG